MSYGEVAAGRRLTEPELRREMVRVGRLVWERGFVAATDGNLSTRLGADRLLVTPSGVSKGFFGTEDLIVLGLDGKPVMRYGNRGRSASSEIAMHLEVYRQRPDVQAVVHAHPPKAVAFSIAGVSLARCVIPEVIVTLGSIPTTGYATPGTAEVPDSIRQAIREYDAIIMTHHGSLTVGKSLWEAYLRLEKVEHTAEITLVAHQLGRVNTLSPQEVDKLVQKRQALLQREGRDVCEGCSVCLLGDQFQVEAGLSSTGASLQDPLVRQITQSVMKKLQET
jgi:L-fuculose-phosphate aldolase